MITQHDLDELGKQLSQDFVSENSPLNDGLKKVATEKGLNREQLQRVAEAANTETYLELMKTAKENYVDFPLADYREVYDGLTKTASASNPFALDDYDQDYETVAHEFAEDISSSMEKVAEEEDLTPTTARLNEAREAQDTIRFLDNAADESCMEIAQDYEALEKEAQQIILSGTPFNHIPEILKVASEYAADSIIEVLTPRLKKYSPFTDLEKEAHVNGRVNTQSSLYKIASKLQDNIIRYLKIEDAIDHYQTKYAELVSKYSLPLTKKAQLGQFLGSGARLGGNVVKGVVTGVAKHPLLSGGIGIYAVGRKTGRAEGARRQGKVMSRRAQYKGKDKRVLKTLKKRT